jgi:hypothetical protein
MAPRFDDAPAGERKRRAGIMRDAMAVFAGVYHYDGDGTVIEMAADLVALTDGEDRTLLGVSIAVYGAGFARFVDQCAAAAGVTNTVLDPGFTAELLEVFARRHQREVDAYERTGVIG